MPAVTKAQQSIIRTGLTGLNATTGVTISWWARYNYTQIALPGRGNIFAHYAVAAVRNGYSMGFNDNGQMTAVIYGSAGSTISAITGNALVRDGRWAHYAMTFDDATDEVLGYVNGKLFGRTTNTRDMTSTTLGLFSLIGGSTESLNEWRGALFDIQVFPDVVVGSDNIQHLMNPLETLPGLRGRYFGCQSVQAGTGTGGVRDESASGNDLTSSTLIPTEAEPPFRFTIA